jgi:hypothetical protein
MPTYLPHDLLSSDQHLLGVYENVPNSIDSAIFVTDQALWVEQSGKVQQVRYDDIEAVTTTPDSKRAADTLKVVTRTGSVVYVPVRGKQPDAADVFAVQRFLIHTIQPANKS